MGPSWAILGPSWAYLCPSWAIWGLSWLVLGPSWAALGPLVAFLGPFLTLLGSLAGLLGRLGVHLGAILGHLGPSWAILGLSLAIVGSSCGDNSDASLKTCISSRRFAQFWECRCKLCLAPSLAPSFQIDERAAIIVTLTLTLSLALATFGDRGHMGSIFQALHLKRASRSHAKTGLTSFNIMAFRLSKMAFSLETSCKNGKMTMLT